MKNETHVTEFVLSGLSSNPSLQLPLFLLCFFVYMVTLLGNLTIIVLIRITPGLQTPMYFFLMNLSLVDVLYSSTITPNIMANILSEHKTISITACATQMFFFIDLASSEAMLLAVIAYDRYAAICKPLYYATLINKLSCKDTYVNEILEYVVAGCIEVGSFLCIFISYTYIILTLFKIGSSRSRIKSLSTCVSHFTCVALFYCPVFFMYLRPNSAYSVDQDWVVSVFYTVIIPMLNPMIYSLRNQDVKLALVKLNKYLLPTINKNFESMSLQNWAYRMKLKRQRSWVKCTAKRCYLHPPHVTQKAGQQCAFCRG
ncbi:olfactory receptor 5AR1-like [Dendropsophus ebraccatus]|uniref:olfactory receptor 5AR1-like n=1 Tax=Dendropsophus ebraccatus TaxID=150705 RepID=UPI00383150AE